MKSFWGTVFAVASLAAGSAVALPRTNAVSWTIGKAASEVDGTVHGPVTFAWTFDRLVEYGAYVDGTPFVIWTNGLQLISVSPNRRSEDLPNLGSVVSNGIVDATCINLDDGELPLDERMGYESGVPDGQAAPWGGGLDVWDESPVALHPGDCIATGLGRRVDRGIQRRMLYTAIGVCNVVSIDMTGRYRPPIRMPRDQRALLVTPMQVSVTNLPTFDIPAPLDWNDSPVTLDPGSAVNTTLDADDLLNGPIGNVGIYSHVWYETANGMLNHNLSGTDAVGYQREVARRFATCLYTAFDPNEEQSRRQRSLNKFIQIGLDYYYMHCLGYSVGNGGGGHPDGIEGAITLAGALLGDAPMTDAVKYQRFLGAAVEDPGQVYDMLSGYHGSFSRSEALYTLSPAAWQTGTFYVRPIGTGATTLDECVPRIDMAHPGMVLNCTNVTYNSISNVDANVSAINLSSSHQWRMYSENVGTEQTRSWRFPPGGVLRIDGDTQIRQILNFQETVGTDWTDSTWPVAQGRGGVMLVHPALTAQEISALGGTGTLTTGVCSRDEAKNDGTVLWESWPVSTLERAQESFFSTPIQDYLDNKLGDFFFWLPFYHLLIDPGAPGKKLYEESMTYNRLRRFVELQRDAGSYQWSLFTRDTAYSLPDSPTIQALVRHYLLDDTMPTDFGKNYRPADQMWSDPALPGTIVRIQ